MLLINSSSALKPCKPVPTDATVPETKSTASVTVSTTAPNTGVEAVEATNGLRSSARSATTPAKY